MGVARWGAAFRPQERASSGPRGVRRLDAWVQLGAELWQGLEVWGRGWAGGGPSPSPFLFVLGFSCPCHSLGTPCLFLGQPLSVVAGVSHRPPSSLGL